MDFVDRITDFFERHFSMFAMPEIRVVDVIEIIVVAVFFYYLLVH